MRAGWTASGACTSGSTVPPRAATTPASGSATTTSMASAEPNLPEGDRSMNDAALKSDIREIVVDKDIPHPPEVVWKALTTAETIARWIREPIGFEPVVGN